MKFYLEKKEIIDGTEGIALYVEGGFEMFYPVSANGIKGAAQKALNDLKRWGVINSLPSCLR